MQFIIFRLMPVSVFPFSNSLDLAEEYKGKKAKKAYLYSAY